jgi:two-component system, sporulation sensor kinase B
MGGSVSIWAESNSSRCLIHVEDNGPGLQGVTFGQAPAFIPPREAGRTGIGLALVLYTVENLGGNLKDCSSGGKGAHFILDFPLISNNS